MSLHSCLSLMAVASHPRGVFGVPCRWRQVSETGGCALVVRCLVSSLSFFFFDFLIIYFIGAGE